MEIIDDVSNEGQIQCKEFCFSGSRHRKGRAELSDGGLRLSRCLQLNRATSLNDKGGAVLRVTVRSS
jgi:hypothetical protein